MKNRFLNDFFRSFFVDFMSKTNECGLICYLKIVYMKRLCKNLLLKNKLLLSKSYNIDFNTMLGHEYVESTIILPFSINYSIEAEPLGFNICLMGRAMYSLGYSEVIKIEYESIDDGFVSTFIEETINKIKDRILEVKNGDAKVDFLEVSNGFKEAHDKECKEDVGDSGSGHIST